MGEKIPDILLFILFFLIHYFFCTCSTPSTTIVDSDNMTSANFTPFITHQSVLYITNNGNLVKTIINDYNGQF